MIEGLEPAKGIEPPTYGLRNRCSTPELRRPAKIKNAHPAKPFNRKAPRVSIEKENRMADALHHLNSIRSL